MWNEQDEKNLQALLARKKRHEMNGPIVSFGKALGEAITQYPERTYDVKWDITRVAPRELRVEINVTLCGEAAEHFVDNSK